MLSNAYFLAKFRFGTAENEPTKNLQNFAKFDYQNLQKDLVLKLLQERVRHLRARHRRDVGPDPLALDLVREANDGGLGALGVLDERRLHLSCIFRKCIFRKFCNFLAGSFSAVSKRNFARKYAFDSIFQALQDLHPFAPLQSRNFRKKIGVKNKHFL